MKKLKSIISTSACLAAMVSAMPFAANAEDGDIIYGKMNIPYADFYAAELNGAPNAYEVDAVSSATNSKSKKNGEGELFEGSYYEEVSGEQNALGNEILVKIQGVTYPVAISKADLDALGENNYGFTALDSAPAAYKKVTVADGKASFSAVEDAEPETKSDASLKLSTNTAWGDYLIDVENAPEGAILGAYVTTADGNKYAFRHEQNIWRGEFAWSSGIKQSEPHGNTLDYENYKGLMGSTVTSLTYINANGYVTVPAELYIPVKFDGEVKAEDSTAGTGKTTVAFNGFPEDYSKNVTIADNITVSGNDINYTDAKPGTYTVSVTDANGKYAPYSGTFTLSTADIPVKYDNGKLVKADGFSDEDAANFIKNIASVEVNGTAFGATGKGATKIVGEDGAVDFSASSRNGNVFDGSGNYNISVTATGYTAPYSFEVKNDSQTSTTTTSGSTTSTTSTTAKSTTTAKSGSSNTTDSPKTGVAGVAVPTAFLAMAGAAAVISRKKK
ncbi:MAG: NPXTG-anchored protein [Ruminococcus sp.]|nr:NPXTG-anchored protein [Ruminococcus sp.]